MLGATDIELCKLMPLLCQSSQAGGDILDGQQSQCNDTWHDRGLYRKIAIETQKRVTSLLGGDGRFCRGDFEQNKQEFARQRALKMVFRTEKIASEKAGRNENR